ncbi:hypothetical protein GDO78_021800 [Eleutherodactylus coqui]|uniref:Uncharacterized protein n=1 Tax=Eleutherodactylus coqui TaxID=57060 RepID=A0A8J6E556_ELECQ|nr:hypothetical protein GDO78_021800 [Eleutherodactylus coqui]
MLSHYLFCTLNAVKMKSKKQMAEFLFFPPISLQIFLQKLCNTLYIPKNDAIKKYNLSRKKQALIWPCQWKNEKVMALGTQLQNELKLND